MKTVPIDSVWELKFKHPLEIKHKKMKFLILRSNFIPDCDPTSKTRIWYNGGFSLITLVIVLSTKFSL